MEHTCKFRGSFLPISGEFSERLRHGAEPPGSLSISEPSKLCTGLGCDWLYPEGQACWLGAQP